MNLIALKLVTGEDILGEVISPALDSDYYVLENPVSMVAGRGQDGKLGIGIVPFPTYGEQKVGTQISIAKKHVVCDYTAAEDFKSAYDRTFGAGLVLPPSKSLIQG